MLECSRFATQMLELLQLQLLLLSLLSSLLLLLYFIAPVGHQIKHHPLPEKLSKVAVKLLLLLLLLLFTVDA